MLERGVDVLEDGKITIRFNRNGPHEFCLGLSREKIQFRWLVPHIFHYHNKKYVCTDR